MERTLSIIKPDGVKKNIIGEVIKRFEEKDLRIAGLKKDQTDKARCAKFLYCSQGKTFLRQPD